jgi:hypothetical protein
VGGRDDFHVVRIREVGGRDDFHVVRIREVGGRDDFDVVRIRFLSANRTTWSRPYRRMEQYVNF